MVLANSRHTYLDCLRIKFERGVMTRQETESLFEYAAAGEHQLGRMEGVKQMVPVGPMERS